MCAYVGNEPSSQKENACKVIVGEENIGVAESRYIDSFFFFSTSNGSNFWLYDNSETRYSAVSNHSIATLTIVNKKNKTKHAIMVTHCL